MKCYNPPCGGTDLPLAPLSDLEREQYAQAGIVGRVCSRCGFFQSHLGDDGETLTPEEAAKQAPAL